MGKHDRPEAFVRKDMGDGETLDAGYIGGRIGVQANGAVFAIGGRNTGGTTLDHGSMLGLRYGQSKIADFQGNAVDMQLDAGVNAHGHPMAQARFSTRYELGETGGRLAGGLAAYQDEAGGHVRLDGYGSGEYKFSDKIKLAAEGGVAATFGSRPDIAAFARGELDARLSDEHGLSAIARVSFKGSVAQGVGYGADVGLYKDIAGGAMRAGVVAGIEQEPGGQAHNKVMLSLTRPF